MRLEKNWVHFAKNMIENVSRETYVRLPFALRGFHAPSCLLQAYPPVFYPSFIPLFPRLFIFRLAESRPKGSSHYAVRPYASKAGTGQNMAAWCIRAFDDMNRKMATKNRQPIWPLSRDILLCAFQQKHQPQQLIACAKLRFRMFAYAWKM